MKISILTATYNREKCLNKLYNSIVKNTKYKVFLEWLIMDDGSVDNTKQVVQSFISESSKNEYLEIKYFQQKNQGKMSAINNLIQFVSDSTLLIECDSDDYFTDDAIKIIYEKYKTIDENDLYALCFLKEDEHLCNIGSVFKKENHKTKMFDLYYKEGIEGDKTLVFFTKIRKMYSYPLEGNEKFCTEARMYNKMDKKYNIKCFNKPILICKYLKEGYSKNINKIFITNPFGYYEYYKELLQFSMKGVLLRKRLYILKHYILFSNLTKQKHILKPVNNVLNKIFITVLWLPGKLKTNIWQKKL